MPKECVEVAIVSMEGTKNHGIVHMRNSMHVPPLLYIILEGLC
jgi:hypothetical protein